MKDHDGRLPEDLRDIADRLTAAREQPSALELDELRHRLHGRVARGRRAPRRGLAGVLRLNGVAAALTMGLVLSSGVGVVFACGSLSPKKPPVATIADKGGNQGRPGNQGNQGNQGNKGSQGYQGGNQGNQGGNQGNQGGNQGNQGGNQGNQGGNQGNQGGNQGNQGGNQGNQGGYGYDPGGYGGVFQGTGFHGHGSASFCQYHGPQTFTYRFPTHHGWVIVILTWDCFHLHFHYEFDPDRGYRFGGLNYRWGNGPSYNCNQSSYDTTAPDGTNDLSFTTDGSTFNLPIAW